MLKTVFTKDGYKYQQIFKNDLAAIYEQTDKGEVLGYEVFKIKRIKDKEIYPSSENFGKTAWYYRDLDKAILKANKIISNGINNSSKS